MAEPDPAGELYALPLEDFTAARNELAARLRKQGDRTAAEAVKGLAKPSLSAWALNQVARRQPKLVAGLLAAGRELGQAQQRLLGGGGQTAFREASQAEKAASAKLVEAAAGALAEAGHPAAKAMLDRLEATARAAATDEAGGQLLEAGRLTADLDPTSFGEGAFGLAPAPIPFPRDRRHSPSAQDPSAQDPSAQDPSAQDPSAQDREEVHRLQREVQALRQQAGQAEGEAARTRQAAARASQAWAGARDTAARAEKLAGEAKRAEDEAAEALAELRRHIDLTADELARAEAELKRRRT